mgnify:CR=1
RDRVNAVGEGMVFMDVREVSRAYYSKSVDLQARIKLRVAEVLVDEETGERIENSDILDTTVGRALLWEIVPQGVPFSMVNKPMVKRAISQVIN